MGYLKYHGDSNYSTIQQVCYHKNLNPEFPAGTYTVKYRCNAVQYCKILYKNKRNWGRISIRCWIYKRHPIPHPLMGELWGIFCEYLWEKRPHYNSTTLYVDIFLYFIRMPKCAVIYSIIRVWNRCIHQGPLLLTWFNFNPSMDNNHMPSIVRDGITYPFLNFNGCTVEVYEWISNFTPHI